MPCGLQYTEVTARQYGGGIKELFLEGIDDIKLVSVPPLTLWRSEQLNTVKHLPTSSQGFDDFPGNSD
jgi:hypothetical protein